MLLLLFLLLLLLLLFLVTDLFSMVHLLLNPRRSRPLRLQVPDCSTFLVMCHVPSIAVFCSESIKFLMAWLPNLSTQLSLPFRWLQLWPIKLWISCATFVLSLYTNNCIYFLSSFLLHDISVCGYCNIYHCACFLFLFFIIKSGLFVVTSLSSCTHGFHNSVTSSFSHIGVGVCTFALVY